MKAATGVEAHPGDLSLWMSLRRFVTRLARVVLPVPILMRGQAAKASIILIPEPGMPDTAIKTRCEGGVSLYFAWQQS